uniref:PPM-type phosphatase domain-containing protein n=1 Tax=Panagrellus redivivus TaxID=6233 RepID=A0A7E4W0M6_PANRE
MGAFLDKPKTEKTNHIGNGRDYRYVVASMQGWRIDMEDAHTVEIQITNSPPFETWSFFAVFDGHAGRRAAFHSAENLLQTILETDEFQKLAVELNSNGHEMTEKCQQYIKDGMRTGFLQLDAAMDESNSDEKERSGTTAICAIMTSDNIFVANLGDSRGVISRTDNDIFATEDHKPYLEKERERILKAGGSVMIQRVNGSLAVSRALGDYEYKSVPGLCPTEQLVSPEPDVYVLNRNKETDEFLILACDGIYDVLENDKLCELVRSRLQATEDLKQATNQVLDVCLSMGSRDNMTMILVLFEGAPTFDPEKAEKEKEWLREADDKLDGIIRGLEPNQADADLVMSMLRREGFEELPLPGGLHLARTLVDLKLKRMEVPENEIIERQTNGGDVSAGSPSSN